IALIICVSVLGSMNGQILTGARVYYAIGRDHPILSPLAHWHPKRNTPIRSLLIQAAISLALIAALGQYENGFINLLNFTTPIFWTFFGLVGFSLFVLRIREPDRDRPYRVHLFPLVPLIFCASCAFMIYSSVSYAVEHRTYEAVLAIAVLVIGLAVSLFLRSCSGGPIPGETPAKETDA
ncbi:MAG: APC family permease, partial [Thermogutta sp.]|nr:APC family permease [Thermogutta sp.]